MITCKQYYQIKKDFIKKEVDALNQKPALAIIQIGNNPASNVYVKNKLKDCEEVGIKGIHIHREDVTEKELENIIIDLNINPKINGIIVQLPLPSHTDFNYIKRVIKKEKDVDGFQNGSYYVPCTPKGIIDWLNINEIDLSGKDVVVLGRSEIVGKPLVNLLIEKGATVTCCNSKTKKDTLHKLLKESDIVISAIGKAKEFTVDNFSDNQIVIDVGINRDENGKLCGDIDSSGIENLTNTYVTPVPGGIGLLTRVSLLENVLLLRTVQEELYKERGCK